MKLIIVIIMIIILWFVASDCNKKLSGKLSREAILIFTAFFYCLIMIVYAYCNFDECRVHFSALNWELVVLLLLIPIITFATTIVYWHMEFPKKLI